MKQHKNAKHITKATDICMNNKEFLKFNFPYGTKWLSIIIKKNEMLSVCVWVWIFLLDAYRVKSYVWYRYNFNYWNIGEFSQYICLNNKVILKFIFSFYTNDNIRISQLLIYFYSSIFFFNYLWSTCYLFIIVLGTENNAIYKTKNSLPS